MAGKGPLVTNFSAAIFAPALAQISTDSPCVQAVKKPAQKASPAPVASCTRRPCKEQFDQPVRVEVVDSFRRSAAAPTSRGNW